MILCSKSDYFNDLCGPSKSFVESGQPVVELKDDDEAAVEAMLRWLYTFDYKTPTSGDKQEDTLDFQLNVRVVADKYLLAGLRDEALQRLKTHLDTANECDLVKLIGKVRYTDTTFPTAVTDAIDKIRNQRLDLLLNNLAFRGLMRSDADLSMSIVDKLRAGFVGALVEQRYLKCPTCKWEELRDKAPGGSYTCSKSQCGSRVLPATAHQTFWVKRG